MAAVKRGTRSLPLIVSTVMLTFACLPHSSACCLKKGSAVGMKWFHCKSDTVAPSRLAGAVVLAAAVGWPAAACVGWAAGACVAWPPVGAVVGLGAGALVGAGGWAGWPHAARRRTAL